MDCLQTIRFRYAKSGIEVSANIRQNVFVNFRRPKLSINFDRFRVILWVSYNLINASGGSEFHPYAFLNSH
jgi:hypothetical protein